jgi:hypothetical protein
MTKLTAIEMEDASSMQRLRQPVAALEAHALGLPARAALAALLALFLAVQGYILLGPHGILASYSLVPAITVFGRIMLANPLTQAGLVDFCTLEATLLVLLANGLPRGRYYLAWLAGLGLVSLVYPGLACLVFLLCFWRRFGQFRA